MINFQILNPPEKLGWIQFTKFLLMIFVCVHEEYNSVVFCNFFLWFWYQGNAGLISQLGSVPSYCILKKNLYRIHIIFFI